MSDEQVAVPRMDAAPLVANLEASMAEFELQLTEAAKNIELLVGRDSKVLLAYAELTFFLLSVDYDMRHLILHLLKEPTSRLVAEKYLALDLLEADDAVGHMFGDVMRRAADASDPMHGWLDVDAFKSVQAGYRKAMGTMRADKAFMATLRNIRNTVAAHMVGKEAGATNSAIWVLTRANIPRTTEGTMTSAIMLHAISTLEAIRGALKALPTTHS